MGVCALFRFRLSIRSFAVFYASPARLRSHDDAIIRIPTLADYSFTCIPLHPIDPLVIETRPCDYRWHVCPKYFHLVVFMPLLDERYYDTDLGLAHPPYSGSCIWAAGPNTNPVLI